METPLSVVAEESSAWSQDEFMQRVRLFCDQFSPGHPGYGLPKDFTWTFTARFKLRRLAGAANEWVRWSAKEKAAWAEDFTPEVDKEIEASWLPEPWLEPVIVVEGADGAFYVWDGNHRIGVAFTAGLATVPAIVGLRNVPGSRLSLQLVAATTEPGRCPASG